jgi:putative transposase
MSLALQETATQGTSLTNLRQMAGLSRACYYRHLSSYRGLSASDPADKDVSLRESIHQMALACSFYGYRRMNHELHRQGVQASRKSVLRLMRMDNLLCLRKKRFVVTTNGDHRLPVYPNLAAEMDITAPDQLWVSDLTYIRLGHELIYLAVVLDACSRRCLGWSLGRRLNAVLATSALKMALKGNNVKGCKRQVHHSDRGVQYASGEYTSLLKDSGVAISMSRKGNPYDNAKAESFTKTLTYEQVYLSEYDILADANAQIGHFLEAVYNQKRLHSSLGYLPPAEFEQAYTLSRDKNKNITP